MASASNEQEVIDQGNVVTLFTNVVLRHREAPASEDELAEYRRIKPLLLEMLREWEMVKGSGGCPVARNLIARD